MAETYHVLEWRELPLRKAAVLAFGLPADSRTKLKLTGERITLEQALMARTVDGIEKLIWQNTENGHRGRNLPPSLLMKLREPAEEKKRVRSFPDGKTFEEERKRILEGIHANNNRDSLCPDPSLDGRNITKLNRGAERPG